MNYHHLVRLKGEKKTLAHHMHESTRFVYFYLGHIGKSGQMVYGTKMHYEITCVIYIRETIN
jgi:hypothetical protein